MSERGEPGVPANGERGPSGPARARGPRLVLLGKQGAGKGTQAVKVAEHYGVTHLATGDLFRAAARDRSPLGIEVSRFLNRGELVPDDVVVGVVEAELARDGGRLTGGGFVIDGFPRTRRQAEELDRVIADAPLDVVVDLDVPTEIVMHRIAGRRVCVQCGTNYHVDNPPRDAWICDVCGGDVVQRDDDREDAVLRRLELYEIQTLPVTQYYRRRGILVNVDGRRGSDEVFKSILEVIDGRFVSV